MIENCKNCPKFTNCSKPCEELEQQLEPPVESLPERPISYYEKEILSDDEKNKRSIAIDDFVKIDPGRMYDDVDPLEIEWTTTPVQPNSAELEEDDIKVLKDAFRWAMLKADLKQRRRFNAFLKCSKIVEIADTANTTKQNIQKQFQLVIRKTHQIILKSSKKADFDPSPHKFKRIIRQT
jgi:hypothetical protein